MGIAQMVLYIDPSEANRFEIYFGFGSGARKQPYFFWKKKYSFLKLVYCSERFKEMYGARRYGELVAFLFREFDEEETRIRAKIDELMRKLLAR